MKLIKRGVDPKNKPFYVGCGNCGSEYECTMNDSEIKTMQGDRPTDPSSKYIICQVCHETIFLHLNHNRQR